MAGRRVETGERVHLRRPSSSDAEAFVSAVRSSRRLHRPWTDLPEDPSGFDDFVRRSRRRDTVSFLICRNADAALAGVATLGQISLGAFRSAYLGYSAFVPLDGRGYMTEGLGLVLRHAFGTLGLHRVEANVQPGNERSLALVRRLGMRREGYSPRYLFIDGAWRDHERWAILADEFLERTRPGEAVGTP